MSSSSTLPCAQLLRCLVWCASTVFCPLFDSPWQRNRATRLGWNTVNHAQDNVRAGLVGGWSEKYLWVSEAKEETYVACGERERERRGERTDQGGVLADSSSTSSSSPSRKGAQEGPRTAKERGEKELGAAGGAATTLRLKTPMHNSQLKASQLHQGWHQRKAKNRPLKTGGFRGGRPKQSVGGGRRQRDVEEGKEGG